MILQANGSQKKVGVAILIPDKIDSTPKKGNKRQRWTLYNDKEDNSSRRHNSYKSIYMHLT